MENFRDLLLQELQKPELLQNGKTMDPMAVIVRSVKVNAMKGDLASIAFIDMMTRNADPGEQARQREEHSTRVRELQAQLTEQLKGEGAYDGQDLEIAQVAEIAETLERLNSMISAPGFQMVVTDFKSGRQTISPAIALRDKQREQFQKELQKLRDDATGRALLRKRSGY